MRVRALWSDCAAGTYVTALAHDLAATGRTSAGAARYRAP